MSNRCYQLGDNRQGVRGADRGWRAQRMERADPGQPLLIRSYGERASREVQRERAIGSDELAGICSHGTSVLLGRDESVDVHESRAEQIVSDALRASPRLTMELELDADRWRLAK
jgi:hypothetical protein